MEQEKIYFKCVDCPDCSHYSVLPKATFKCHYDNLPDVECWGIIDVDPHKDIPEWCPRFPL